MGKIAFIALLIILILSTASTSFVEAQSVMGQEIAEEVQGATQTINDNQILKAWQNRSTQIGIGTVLGVTCKEDLLDEIRGIRAIFTYASILVDTPLTDNLKSGQTVLAKYEGGQIGDKWADVCIDWVTYPNDTVTAPERFILNEGLSIMFFVNETRNELVGYLPYKSATLASQHTTEKLLLSEPQPTTNINEPYGYGFDWEGCIVPWDHLPWVFQIDLDGTDDIDGEDTDREFLAIRTGICTWEGAPDSGFTVSDGGYWNYTTNSEYADPDDNHNVIGWVDDMPWDQVGACHRHGNVGHLTKADISLNDDYDWTIGWSVTCYDVQSIVTHEFGHIVGLQNLDTSSNAEQTMHIPATHDTSQQTLEWGDLNGAHYLYPEHDDAGSGGDGSDSFGGATTVQFNQAYSGRLCSLPDHVDTEDYFKIYVVWDMSVNFYLDVTSQTNFDLELWDPNGNLVDWSCNPILGSNEYINRYPMGSSGFWRMRVYTSEEGAEGTGQYVFVISSTYKYVSDAWGEILSGDAGYWDPHAARGSSPDDSEAGVVGYDYGAAAAIMGEMNEQVSGTRNVYIYGHAQENDIHIFVYVSNDYNTWYNIFNDYIEPTSPQIIYVGSTTVSWRYIGISCYIDYGPAAFRIDCVAVT